jgi:acetyl esterase/lipase
MRFSTWYVGLRRNVFKASGFARWRKEVERRPYPSPAPLPKDFNTKYQVQEKRVAGQLVYTVSPSTRTVQKVHIIYTHGGAYVQPLRTDHWNIIRKLIEYVGASVTVPIYPLAPEYDHHTAFALLEGVYRDVLLNFPDHRIVLCGDSAGGGLALAQAMRYRDLGLRMPDQVVLVAPWVDITMSNSEAAAVEPIDIMLGIPGLTEAGLWWAGGEDPRSPMLSPIYGRLSGLPPIYIFQGSSDLLVADARQLHDNIAKSGGVVELYEYTGAFHVFIGATFTWEAKDVFQRVAKLME